MVDKNGKVKRSKVANGNKGNITNGNGKCSGTSVFCEEDGDCACNSESTLLSSSGRHPPKDFPCQFTKNGKKQDSNIWQSNHPKKSSCCYKIEEYLEHLGKGTTWLAIIFGQILSLLLCVSSISTVYLTDVHRIYLPNAQNFAFYILLATIFTTILACRPGERNLFPILRTRGWKYAFVALADAEANFLVNKSYQLTTLTSVQLLDCFAIPTVLSLSWLVLRIRFKVPHIFGVSICLLGLCCLVWADVEDGKPLPPEKNRFLGDMICLSGAFLHGISNVAQEFSVKTFEIVEFLAMIGLFGSFISGSQTLLLEYGAVTSTEWTPYSAPAVTFAIHIAAKFLFYLISAFVMKWSGATAVNLSLLTADFYCLIVAIFLFQVKVHALYFLSFVLVMSGVLVFSIKPTIIASHIYKSLTREVTTTLDLELMASSPLYHPADNQHHHFYSNGNHPNLLNDVEERDRGSYPPAARADNNSLRLGNRSSLLNQQNQVQMQRESGNGPPELLCNKIHNRAQLELEIELSQHQHQLVNESCDVIPTNVGEAS